MEKKGLQIFDYKQNDVRTFVNDAKPWFALTDVCRVLEVKNPSVTAKRLDPDERSKFNLGRQGNTWFVNESGLYSVILRSDKPEAKQFKRWITHEVLPAIRKTGQYVAKPQTKALPDPMKAKRLDIAQQNVNVRTAKMWLEIADREKNEAKKAGYLQRAEYALQGNTIEADISAEEAAYKLGQEYRRHGKPLKSSAVTNYMIDRGVALGIIDASAAVEREHVYKAYKEGYCS